MIGKLESNNNYKAKNSLGYLGRYQMGKIALIDLGYMSDYSTWTGKNGITSEEIFLDSPIIQDIIMNIYSNKNLIYLRRKKVFRFIGKKYKNILVTKTGLLACSHLLGAGGTSRMLSSGVVGKDAYGTKGTKYLKQLQNIKID